MGRHTSVNWRVVSSDVTPGGTVYRLFGVDADDPTTYALVTLNIDDFTSPRDLYDAVVWGDRSFMTDLLTSTYAVSDAHDEFIDQALEALSDDDHS